MQNDMYDVDTGWAWIVLTAVYVGRIILLTSLYMSGIFYVALLDYFHGDVTKTSIIGSLNSGLLCLCGFGNSMASVPFSVTLGYYFQKRRNTVISLSVAVIGLGMFIASPFSLYLISPGLQCLIVATPLMTLHVGMLGVAGVATLTFPYYSHFDAAGYFYAAVAGFYTGGPTSVMTPITLRLVGVKDLSSARGLEVFFCGIGVLAGPPIAGLVVLAGSVLGILSSIKAPAAITEDIQEETIVPPPDHDDQGKQH